MDNDTQQIFQEGEQVNDFVKSKGWSIVKQKFTDKMMDLQSVLNVKTNDPQVMAVEVQARQLASTYLYDLLRDIEGQAQQHSANQELYQDHIIQ